MKLSDFDYALPPERIAQRPLDARDDSRLLVLPRTEGAAQHAHFVDLPARLRAGDLLVLNDTRVFPARLIGRKVASGGRVEALLIESLGASRWSAICGSSKPLREGAELVFEGGEGEVLRATLERSEGDGVHLLAFDCDDAALMQVLEAGLGEIPLPPYIHREAEAEDWAEPPARLDDDRQRYQTVFARERGAVAAPTAGLHFTPQTFEALEAAGIERTFVTLHVGPGTFLPIRGETVEGHRMHEEVYEISPAAVEAIEACRARGGRVIGVGTTSLRALESAAVAAEDAAGVPLLPGRARTRLFVKPGYRFQIVDGLLTNFHLPRSTLLMLVAAMVGRERLLEAYQEAIAREYRFYSYGDAMLVL